jgi:4-amino-4-deoxy-L-arabinose transferase-like glycosyltransferase
MSKGLFVPLTFAATALAVGILVPACRRRSYWKMVGAAVLVSLPFFVIWPALLAQHSMPLFMEWFWDNNVGRFFGFSVQKLGSDNDHTVILRALAGFALPVSLLALLALSSGDWRQAGTSRVAVPLAFGAISLAVLQSSATARQLYLLPVLLPLAMLGARPAPPAAAAPPGMGLVVAPALRHPGRGDLGHLPRFHQPGRPAPGHHGQMAAAGLRHRLSWPCWRPAP